MPPGEPYGIQNPLTENLDVGTFGIISSSNGDIPITPNGTGTVIIDGEVDMVDNPITDIGYFDFNLTNGTAAAEGRMVWNSDDGTLNLGMKGGNVNQQIGLESLVYGKNVTGTGTTNGKAVRISGASGSNPEFNFADADNPAAAGSIGLFTEDINNNGNGYVTTFGLVRDIDTRGTNEGEVWASADRLYVSNTPGQLTNVAPTGNERKIFIGIVLRANQTEGVIWVSPINVSYLSELSGMGISGASEGQILYYDANTSLWINTSIILVDDTTSFVGIGTAPNERLEVSGNLRLSADHEAEGFTDIHW